MASPLHEYFYLRCDQTLEALINMRSVLGDLRGRASHDRVQALVCTEYDAVQRGIDNIARIIGRDTPQPVPSHEEQRPDQIVVVGRTWAGHDGLTTVEHYRVYFMQVPPHLVEVNAALLAEELSHFNLGNYTGLIVLAKELGLHDAAACLQDSIDCEIGARATIENSLWLVVRDLHQQEGEERRAA